MMERDFFEPVKSVELWKREEAAEFARSAIGSQQLHLTQWMHYRAVNDVMDLAQYLDLTPIETLTALHEIFLDHSASELELHP